MASVRTTVNTFQKDVLKSIQNNLNSKGLSFERAANKDYIVLFTGDNAFKAALLNYGESLFNKRQIPRPFINDAIDYVKENGLNYEEYVTTSIDNISNFAKSMVKLRVAEAMLENMHSDRYPALLPQTVKWKRYKGAAQPEKVFVYTGELIDSVENLIEEAKAELR